MKAPKCRTCGKEHWGSVCAPADAAQKTDAKPSPKAKAPAKSTAARKDVRALDVSVPRSQKATATLSGSIPDAAKANDVAPQAGTQALPVDTASSPSGKASGFGPDTAGSNPAEATIAPLPPPSPEWVDMLKTMEEGRQTIADAFGLTPKRGPGRPKTIEDMKAYKAAKARERRARIKAEQEAKK